jgi:hypothetical protein
MTCSRGEKERERGKDGVWHRAHGSRWEWEWSDNDRTDGTGRRAERMHAGHHAPLCLFAHLNEMRLSRAARVAPPRDRT